MCTKSKYVYNSYIGRKILVTCGKCPACQQQKANARTLRIRNHSKVGYFPLFVTLTYSNDYIPYVLKSDILSDEYELPVFRNCTSRLLKNGNIKKNINPDIIDTVVNPRFDRSVDKPINFRSIPTLVRANGCVGIVYYRDVQNFMKRLRITLKRKYNYNEYISYFAVGEYGSTTKRPHFHMLLYVRAGFEKDVTSAIASCWSYGDMSRENKRIQVARDAASYVSSYVNCSSSLPKILQTRTFRQKHASSKDFGVGLSAFSLNSLLQKADKQDMCYRKQVIVDGLPRLVALPIPKYVINRFFPRFKGDFRLTPLEIRELLRFPSEQLRLLQFDPRFRGDIVYTNSDCISILTRLENCFKKYHRITGRSRFDYSCDYLSVWNARSSYVLKHSYDCISDFRDFYENISDYRFGIVRSLNLDELAIDCYELNPNLRGDIVRSTISLIQLYEKKDKCKKVNNHVLSKLDVQF